MGYQAATPFALAPDRAQSEVEEAFVEQLRACREQVSINRQAGGTLIAGGFGSGKSHLLELPSGPGFIVTLRL